MWVVRLEGDKFHSSWETYLDADNFVKYLNKTGITASFGFEANITKDTYSIPSLKEQEEREQFAKKMIKIMETREFRKFYHGNWVFLTDEEVIKEIQKLFQLAILIGVKEKNEKII